MLLFLDGMAHYDTARIGHKYTVRDDTWAAWSIVAEGRFGNCLKRVSNSNNAQSAYLGVTPLTNRTGLWTPQPGGVCGFAIKVDDLDRVSGVVVSAFADALFVVEEAGLSPSGGGDGYHLKVNLNTNGTFTLRRRHISSDVVLANSIEGLSSGTWMYLEFKWLIHDTLGTFEIRVNGVTVLTYAGDTRIDVTNFGYWNSIRLFGVSSTPGPPYLTMRMCDLYLADLTAPLAADVSDFLGDGIIDTIVPNGVGAASAWTPSAAPNWDTVNDRPVPDDDATYVAALAAGLKDVHQFEDIPVASVVKGIHVNILARKETEGSCAVAPIVRQGATDYVGPTQGVASPSYDRYITQAYDLNPATNAKFTAAEINAGQFGVQKVS